MAPESKVVNIKFLSRYKLHCVFFLTSQSGNFKEAALQSETVDLYCVEEIALYIFASVICLQATSTGWAGNGDSENE